MMNKKIRKLVALCVSAASVLSLAGCGGSGHQAADVDPDTPVSEVTFPLEEQAELSFITSAPATSTQDPNERMIFKRLEEQTNVHIVLWQISSQTKRTWLWLSLEIFLTDFLMQA